MNATVTSQVQEALSRLAVAFEIRQGEKGTEFHTKGPGDWPFMVQSNGPYGFTLCRQGRPQHYAVARWYAQSKHKTEEAALEALIVWVNDKSKHPYTPYPNI